MFLAEVMYESEMHTATHIKSKMWWADFDKETCHISASSYQCESTRPMQTHTHTVRKHTDTQTQQTDSWAAFALRRTSLPIVLRLVLLTARGCLQIRVDTTHAQTTRNTHCDWQWNDLLLMALWSTLQGWHIYCYRTFTDFVYCLCPL